MIIKAVTKSGRKINYVVSVSTIKDKIKGGIVTQKSIQGAAIETVMIAVKRRFNERLYSVDLKRMFVQ